MLSSDNRKNVAPTDPSDLTIGDLLMALADHKDRPLVFRYDGRPVKPGYHVTEVKAGQFSALDCEANPESWSEIFVQLWDVDEGGPVHMPAGKFVGGAVEVELSPRPSSCKPRDRWLKQQAAAASQPCCGASRCC